MPGHLHSIEMHNDSMCRSWLDKLRRMFHWGPIIVLPIIFYISSVTLRCSLHSSPPSTSLSGVIQVVFLVGMLYAILQSYFCSIFVGPGFVPLGWTPLNKSVRSKLQFCRVCHGYKPPRSHHCRSCGRCVMKMDHHCPWINTCCGHLNHGHFIHFVISASVGCLGCTLILSPIVYRIFTSLPGVFLHDTAAALVNSIYDLILMLFALGLAIGVSISVGVLAIYQLLGVRKNETGIESWILDKAKARRKQSTLDPFVFPYDLGCWENFRQVITWSGEAIGDGIHWPVRPGCGQYDLTIEQIRQKQLKQLLRRDHRVIQAYSGRCCSCVELGCCTACRSPYMNESRLPVKPGDVVMVTRWSKYWLYGELKMDGSNFSSMTNGYRTALSGTERGWVPRRCLVELTQSDVASKRD